MMGLESLMLAMIFILSFLTTFSEAIRNDNWAKHTVNMVAINFFVVLIYLSGGWQ